MLFILSYIIPTYKWFWLVFWFSSVYLWIFFSENICQECIAYTSLSTCVHENFIHLLSNKNNSLDGLIFELKGFPFETQIQNLCLFLDLKEKKRMYLVCSLFLNYTRY